MVDIELDNITFSYRWGEIEPIFSEFSLRITPGQWVVMVGPSGAGKTTLIKMIKGLLQPQAGEIRINGTLLAPGELNHLAACVFANPENQIVSPIVAEDVAFGLENAGLAPDIIQMRVETSLCQVGLADKSEAFGHHLSGGEQQRLILASALALGKPCLLLDDPLCMVSGKSREEMLRLLSNIRGSCTIVHTTHLLEEAFPAQRLVAIEGGKLLFDGSPRGFLREKGLVEHLGLEVPPIFELGQELANSGLSQADGVGTLEELWAALASNH
jgi:energy-coupling factor transport system ATP-binding protein